MTQATRSGGSGAAPAKSTQTRLPEWDLSDLYASPDAARVNEDLERAAQLVGDFARTYRGQIGALAVARNGAALAQAIQAYEEIEDLTGRLSSYASLLYATDMTDAGHAKFYGDMQARLTALGSDLVFFSVELNAIDDATFEALCSDAALAPYRNWLADLRLMRPYQLSDELERLLYEKSMTGRAAWNRLFDETMGRLTFDFRGTSLTLEETLDKLSDPDSAVRRDGAAALSATFSEALPVFTLITNTLAKDKEIEDRWRKLPAPDMSRHIANRVEPHVVEALVTAVRAAYPALSHRYYALKAKWMGLPALDYWDRNAPLPQEDTKRHSWDEARDIVLGAYGDFAPWMTELAMPFFEKGWIDAAPRPGKASGAFSHPTVPSAHPFILLNYQGRTRDVMTLAHELGHGVHQRLAARQGPLLADTPLTLAETASVFGEMLTFRRLLGQIDNPAQRKVMIASKVEDMLNTAVRQIAFYTFEQRVHAARREGELTAAQLGDIWLGVQSESLGPAIRLSAGYETYWCYIPHFIHAPFYVYAYAFGDCLVN